jgi:hypothetical protein
VKIDDAQPRLDEIYRLTEEADPWVLWFDLSSTLEFLTTDVDQSKDEKLAALLHEALEEELREPIRAISQRVLDEYLDAQLEAAGCEFGCEPDDCGHEHCEVCQHTKHCCAGCDGNYCECTEPEWVEGQNGITYCSQYCADRFGKKKA